MVYLGYKNHQPGVIAGRFIRAAFELTLNM